MLDAESEAASQLARTLYRNSPFRVRLQQRFRPYICPFEPLVPEIRAGGGRLLDFGCGAGLFAFHCVVSRYVDSATGVDVDQSVIGIAESIRLSMTQAPQLSFSVQDIPDGTYEAVSMIDVMHHLRPDNQRATFADLCGRLSAGGVLVYKDMARQPRWRAVANRLHDLVLNQQWIHYVPIETVIEWATDDLGLRLVRQARFNQLIYGHELAVFRKPDGRSIAPPG